MTFPQPSPGIVVGMDDDYEELGFHHLDTLLAGHEPVGPILPGVDLTVWVQLAVAGLGLALLVTVLAMVLL